MDRWGFLKIATALGAAAGFGLALDTQTNSFQKPKPTNEQISRARQLHEESIVVIAHDHRFLRPDFEDTKRG
jgi:hypothetical protein